jgi:hypothetical protein
MRNKIWSLVLVLVVAVCGMVFVACGGQTPGTNVSLSIVSGLDSGLDSSTLLNLSNELSLSENEKVSLGSGMGYDSKIQSGKVITLLVDSENFSSREIIVKINGYEEGMGQLINFSSDSSNITFSEVEYLSGGRAKVVITGINAGTAEVTVTSGQYSKQTNFTVKVLQIPSRFSVKTDAVIYLQKNSTLTINAEDYVDFYPFTTNMRDLEFYLGTTLLTNNGVTTITSIAGRPNAITEDVLLTIKSTRMNKEDDVQPIQVKVIDNISQFGLKKLEYLENGNNIENKYKLINDEILTVVKNSTKVYNKGEFNEFSISYGIRDVYVIVQNKETELEINTKVFINGVETSILCLPVNYEFITESNYLSYINTDYSEMLEDFIGEQSSYSFHVYKFEFQYTGYDAYNVEFSFNFENYIYPEKKELNIEFKSASNLVEFRKSTETIEYNNYTIYDSYNGVFGTKFITKTNTGTLPYTLQIVVDANTKNNLEFLTTTGKEKPLVGSGDKYVLSVTNGEDFYIKGKAGSANVNAYRLTVKVIYEHDNIVFETSKVVDVFVQRAPGFLRFNKSETGPQTEGDSSNINKYYFDLNTSNVRIGAGGVILDYNTSSSTLSIYLYSYDSNGNLIGNATDFSISSSSKNISVTKDETVLNKINIVANSVGTGSFTIILGNNVRNTFTFEIIQSVSEFEISFPSEDQNSNVFSLKTDYEYGGNTYNNYLIALTNKSIPVIISKVGNIDSLSITCNENSKNYVVYGNGYLKTNEDFQNKIAQVTLTYKYIDGNNNIVPVTIVVDTVLVTSITNISNFNLTTGKNSNNFSLYDYSSVGYYAKDLSTTSVYIDIAPLNLKEVFLGEIVWGTNITNPDGSKIVPEITNETYILRTDIFVFTYYKTTGAGVLTCNISEDKHHLYYNDEGKFTGGTIVLTAKIDRSEYGVYTKSLQFNVIKNEKVDTIVTNLNEIALDEYSNEVNLFINLYPVTAINKNLIYRFIPGEGLNSSSVELITNNDGSLKVRLNSTSVGIGTLRIIAADSFTDANNFKKWVDVKITISNGSQAYPYQISSIESVQKMINTNFSKYYNISGVIDLSKTNWNFSNYILTGHITGNNAELKGISITYKEGNYLGLFKEIQGSIRNLKISGTINVDFTDRSSNQMIYIGLLAGKNSGTIENVYVELNGGNVIAFNDYKLSIGGVVGLNTGTMTTTISENAKNTRMILFKDFFNFIDRTLSNMKTNLSHTIYIGGVAGINQDGIISKIMTTELTDFNNSYTTAEVYINAYYSQEGLVHGEEAIGGICGFSDYNLYSSKGLFGVSAYGEITAGRYNDLEKTREYSQSYSQENNIFYGHFNNVGGLVGNNELTISSYNPNINSPETQVFVRGKNYVGGAVGKNTGLIQYLKVEVIEIKKDNEYKKGLNASLVIGENYVGGIVGDHNKGEIESSSFISYLKRTQIPYVFISINNNQYFGDVVAIEVENIQTQMGLLFGGQEEGTVNYVVGIGNVQFVSTSADTGWNNAQNLSAIISNNYAIYGDFIDQNDNSTNSFVMVIINGSATTKTKEQLSNTTGFEFIYLPPNSIDLQLGDKGLENEMSTEEAGKKLAFYLFYYESSDKDVQNIILTNGLNDVNISDYINLEELKKCVLSISNPSILEVDNGQFKIKGTGYVKISISTPYNIELQDHFYIYIINHTNNISAYLSSNKLNNEIKTGDNITFDASESFMIYFSFTDKENVYYLTIPTDIKVLAKVTKTDRSEIIVKAGTGVDPSVGFGLIKISEDAYQFVVDGTIISNLQSIEFIPYIEEVFENIIYTTYPDTGTDKKIIKTENEKVVDVIGTAIGLSLKETLEFNYRLVNTTKSINLSKDSITTEPYYETGVDVILNSLHDNETLNIRIVMKDLETGLIDTSFDPNWIKIVARYGDRIIENGTENERSNLFSISGINAKNNNKISFTFRYENKYRDFTEKKVFIITFVASNKVAELTLIYEPQKIINITTTMYDWKNANDEQYNFSGSFSYIPSNIMIPGQRSLLEFNLVPYYTNYSYIEIINVQTNESLLLFDLFNRTTEARIDGANAINGGIRINKELIENGKFYLRTFLSEEISDETTVSIKIILKDKNGNEVVSPITKTFYVKHLPGVRLTIDGVTSGNTETSRLKLARGLTYDINVWVKGYSAGDLAKTDKGYIDGELVFDISENPNLVSIIKNSDGTYRLVVSGNAITGGRTVCITTYGKNSKGETGKEIKLYIEIVEFVVKAQIGDIVQEVFSNVHSSAIGNSFEFEIALNNNMLIYDSSNPDVIQKVTAFLRSLSIGIVGEEKISVWSYQDLSKSSTTWARVSETNSLFTSTAIPNVRQYKTENGVFTMRFNTTTQVFSIIFTKIENHNNPTFRFKFNASYYYNNGVPTLIATTQPSPSTSRYNLEQVFVFDVFEKTDLRNPYPIYTPEQFMDMREGNYYILLSDIVLPSDFKPITTKIGGLDGNNHRIIFSNINISSTRNNENLSFGLFAQTTEDTLLENIILYINGNITINSQNFNNVVYRLLVGINYGQITNCAIEGENLPKVYFNLRGTSSSSTTITNNVGALVGVNYGNITHSRVEVGILINDETGDAGSYMPANLGGLVAVNKSGGSIASSYVNAIVRNSTSSVFVKTGGVVAVNDFGGRIFTTYISGNYLRTNSTFADDKETAIVDSGASAGAFVYENSGVILNCYANIPMKTNGASSGFVYESKENGEISYCYSTSLVKENDAGNSSFVGILPDGTILDYSNGKIKNCFSLEDSTSNETYNSGIGSNAGVKGLSVITKEKFKPEGKEFLSFAFSQTSDKSDGIWFWPNADMENVFIRNGNYMSFKEGRPELVAPNIISTGTKTFNYSEYIEETGITKYHYLQDANYKEGTKFNPYIIATTDDIEFMKEDATNFIIGNYYYRIICDLIYETSTVSSGLYRYSFLGNIEGNGFTIGNYVLDSSSAMDSAGFFATIGTQSNQTGSIKNLTFAPRYISLTNANCVGAVAGKAYSTTLVNILVDGYYYNASGVVILGRNCIGGVVGLALGNYNFNEISSNISVNATYRSTLNDDNIQLFSSTNYTKSSYAGLIVGAADSSGKLININVYGDNVSIGEIAGLVFGFVGRNVIAEKLNITSSSKQYIKADAYGGVVAGHNEGTLKDITIVDKNKASFFVSDNYIPIAVGNLVGIMTGGVIKNAIFTADLKTQTGVRYVGGAVGLMRAGTLENVRINGDIIAGSTIGGLIGQIFNTANSWKVTIIDSYHNGSISSTSSDSTVRIGSVVGYADVGSDEIALENGEYNLLDADKKVNILLSNNFTNDIVKDNKKKDIYSDTSIDGVNFAYSNNLQIWIGIIVHKASDNSVNRGALLVGYNPLKHKPSDNNENQDLKIIYNIDSKSVIEVVNPLGYLLNGEQTRR